MRVGDLLAAILAAVDGDRFFVLGHGKPDRGLAHIGGFWRIVDIDHEAISFRAHGHWHLHAFEAAGGLPDGHLDCGFVGAVHVGDSVDHDLRRVDAAVAAGERVVALAFAVLGARQCVVPTEVVPVVHREGQGDHTALVAVPVQQLVCWWAG